jgi:hypothetical protein
MFKFFLLFLRSQILFLISIFDPCTLYFQSDSLFALPIMNYVVSKCDEILLAIIPINILYIVDKKVIGR